MLFCGGGQEFGFRGGGGRGNSFNLSNFLVATLLGGHDHEFEENWSVPERSQIAM